MDRRQFISGAAASLALWHTQPFASALQQPKGDPKLIWIVLRGALDSIETVIPTFDAGLAPLRPTLGLPKSSLNQLMEHGFALHPALKNLYGWYQDKQLLPIVAVGSGFSKRSHFDGQDYLESGLASIDHDNGWLSRAIELKKHSAIAISQSTPISLRGSDNVNTWYPSKLKHSSDELYQSLKMMYQDDMPLLSKLNDGLELRQITSSQLLSKKNGRFETLTKGCGQLMAAPQGPDCAMLELGGWDTHNNQNRRLSKQLSQLDNGLAALKKGLGKQWDNTAIVIATEFGRTAKENGTKGTDHGTASVLLMAGGAVRGGRVLGQWPGLAPSQLFKERDLSPTSNTFSWLATLLNQHWNIAPKSASALFDNLPLYKEHLTIN